jgi:hypothetical protein
MSEVSRVIHSLLSCRSLYFAVIIADVMMHFLMVWHDGSGELAVFNVHNDKLKCITNQTLYGGKLKSAAIPVNIVMLRFFLGDRRKAVMVRVFPSKLLASSFSLQIVCSV